MGRPVSTIRFSRTSKDESRVYVGSDYVGDVYADDDILRPGKRVYTIHLDFDWRGPRRVRDRSRVRETAQRMVDTLPWRQSLRPARGASRSRKREVPK